MVSLPWVPNNSPKLKQVYQQAGFKTVFKSNKNLSQILTTRKKPKLKQNSNLGVYKIVCKCDLVYIDETQLNISTPESAIANHCQHCDKDVDWAKTKTLSKEQNKFKRKVNEALMIQYHNTLTPNGMNLEEGRYVTSKFWLPLFKFMQKEDTA